MIEQEKEQEDRNHMLIQTPQRQARKVTVETHAWGGRVARGTDCAGHVGERKNADQESEDRKWLKDDTTTICVL